MAVVNGSFDIKSRFDKVDAELLSMKDDLARAIRELSLVAEKQADATLKQAEATEVLGDKVLELSTQFKSFLAIASSAIPVKVVFYMFLILMLCIGGIETIKVLPKFIGAGALGVLP